MSELPPLIDVIVPVYDVEEYLPRCVESLLAQDLDRFTVTLVDDGSPDGCGAMCDRYAAEYPGKVQVIHQANAGLAQARNAGLRASRAPFVTFVDSDDRVSPGYLSALYAALESSGADMAAAALCGERPRPDGGTALAPYAPFPAPLLSPEDALAEMCREESYSGCGCGRLIRRQIAEACPFPPGRLFEDAFTVWRQIMACRRIACVQNAVYYYLHRPGSIQRRRFEPRHMDLLDAVTEMMDAFRAADMPPAVLAAGAYKVCRSCYVTAFHAADLPLREFRPVCGRLLPLLRQYYPAARGQLRRGVKERLMMRLLLTSRTLFYAVVKLAG